MNFQFQHKNWLWLWVILALVLLLYVLYLVWKRKTLYRIGDPVLVQALMPAYSRRLSSLKYMLLFLALATGILAVMNPGKWGGEEQLKRKGIDIAIALDVSRSMLAADKAPNRLERAKQFVTKLMDEMPDDRIALILFAGKAYMQMPLTTDHGAAKLFVASAGPDAVPQQGTVLSDAMTISSRAFSATEKRFKTILLISDGEDHDRDAVQTARDLASKGVMIVTVGIGSAEGSVIPDPLTGQPKTDASGNTIISKLNESSLKEIAAATNGIYINLESSEEALSMVKTQLAQIDRKAFSDISQMNFRGLFSWLALLMFLFLLTEQLIPATKKLAL